MAEPPGRQAAPLRRTGQGRHLPVHVRRPQPGRHLRLQAGPLPAGRQDDRDQHEGPRRLEEPGPGGGPEVAVQAVRRVRQVGVRPVPEPRRLRRRHRLHPLDDRGCPASRLRHAADEQRPHPLRQPRSRLLGELRPGHREREPARLRRHARPDRRADQRRQELVERLHAGQLPGHGDPVERHADPGARPAARHVAPGAAPFARSPARVQRGARRAASREQRAGGPHRELRTRLPDAAARAGSGRPVRRVGGDPEPLRPRPGPHEGLRQALPAGAPSGRARRTLHPGVLRRKPQRQQLGRPRRSGQEPRVPRRRDRLTNRRPAAGPEAAWPARQHPGHLGRRVRPPADRRVR